MPAQNTSTDQFDKDVLQSETPVIVDFWAEWCGPCKQIAPILEEISQEMGDKITVKKLNIDENQELAIQYGVSSIPTLMIFKNGERAGNPKIGVSPKAQIISWINQTIE